MDNLIVADLPLLELTTMQVYVQPRVVRTTEYFLDRIPESELTDTDIHIIMLIARLDVNPMSPVPLHPDDTIVERTGKQLGAVSFNGGSPSPDVFRTRHIPHERISRPWKYKKLKYKKPYRNRYILQPTPITDPVPPSTTDETNSPTYDGPDRTSVKFRRTNTFTAAHNIIMATTQHVPAKMILDSGAGIFGVGEQWKLTDISRMSSVSIQGAYGDSMRPSIQDFLGCEKLPAVLVPGIKDDIYSLGGILNSCGTTGAKDKVAIFTKNGAVVLTADSCQEAILLAISNKEKTHTADQVDGIYALRQDMSVPPSSHLCALQSHQIPLPSTEHLDGFYGGYTVPGLH